MSGARACCETIYFKRDDEKDEELVHDQSQPPTICDDRRHHFAGYLRQQARECGANSFTSRGHSFALFRGKE
jgi:hypothetical protein